LPSFCLSWLTANQVLFSLIGFSIIYVILLALFLYLLTKKIKHGPYDESDIDDRPLQSDIARVASNQL